MASLSSPKHPPIEADSGKLEPLALPSPEAHWGGISSNGRPADFHDMAKLSNRKRRGTNDVEA